MAGSHFSIFITGPKLEAGFLTGGLDLDWPTHLRYLTGLESRTLA